MGASWRYAAILAAVTTVCSVARAHELSCAKTVNGQSVSVIDSFPATLHWELTVSNAHPTMPSDVLDADDAMLAKYGFAFTPEQFTLAVGASKTETFDLTVKDAKDCEKIARESHHPEGDDDGGLFQSADDQDKADKDKHDDDGEGGDDDDVDNVFIDNTFTVRWDDGSASCSARAVCVETGEECTPENGKTRGLGFWKTHTDAVQACLAGGAIDLGIADVTDLSSAEGILWGSPAKFGDGAKRDKLDHMRFILARELLVAECNQRVFGAQPTPSDEFSQALALIEGTDCQAIQAFHIKLEHFNSCGESEPLKWGPADPKDAQGVASDPTSPSGQNCGD